MVPIKHWAIPTPRITGKYLGYAAIASGVGSIVGILALSTFLPWFIMEAYAIIYAVPCRPVPIDMPIALSSAGLGIGITVLATWFAVAATLREKPSTLMLPRAPKAGKRILLERIRPVWSRLTFSWKVTARNLFRYKRRFCMAIIGIAGCTPCCSRAWTREFHQRHHRQTVWRAVPLQHDRAHE